MYNSEALLLNKSQLRKKISMKILSRLREIIGMIKRDNKLGSLLLYINLQFMHFLTFLNTNTRVLFDSFLNKSLNVSFL